ncbi:MAG: molybdenum cofactor guanylyltransferase [Bacteroidetes bacterium]|nr:molybdenum cofactor guanylyltransferase [Bacteroidota bacterium]
MIKKDITGIILAGGKSSRMGSDKGMIQLNGKRFIEHILEALIPNVSDIIIIANNDNYNNLGYKVYEDIIKDRGPLGGIYTGLRNSKTENNIIVSCDIPFINSGLIKHIIKNMGRTDISVPVFEGNTEPLCAVYTKEITGKIKDLIINNELKIHNVLKHFITTEVHITNKLDFYNKRLLANINTPEELKTSKEGIL